MRGWITRQGDLASSIELDHISSLAEHGSITERLVGTICACDVLVADVTEANPNVMYEIGLRHARERPCVLLTYGQPEVLPFDIRNLDVHNYSFSPSLESWNPSADPLPMLEVPKLAEWLRNLVEQKQFSAVPLQQPVWRSLGEVPAHVPLRREAGVLYRAFNAATWPSYEDVHSAVLQDVSSSRDRESVDSLQYLDDFIDATLQDYVEPCLQTEDFKRLRIYFAYPVRDGVPVGGSLLRYCQDKDDEDGSHRLIMGEFVIGISNPGTRFVQKKWREGRAIPGWAEGGANSICAYVFHTGNAELKRALREDPEDKTRNYDTPAEQSLLAVPIEWRCVEGCARVGVLVASSETKHLNYSKNVEERVRNLGVILGVMFAVYATNARRELDAFYQKHHLDYSGMRGCDTAAKGSPGTLFKKRVCALRVLVAEHFETRFLNKSIHTYDAEGLKVRHGQPKHLEGVGP